MSDHHVIREFGSIFRQSDFPGEKDTIDSVYLMHKSFDKLKDFVAENTDPGIAVDVAFSVHRSKGRDQIKVGNYVGVIEIQGGTSLEILPKIHLSDHKNDEAMTRTIFLKMLRFLRDSPFKSIDQAHLKTSRFPILEVFITTYLIELNKLINRGLKQHYVFKEENAKFLKGRLNFTDHLRENLLHRERFHISFDEFSLNIPQNKIIKSTLLLLTGKSKLTRNKILINNYIGLLDAIDASENHHHDFAVIDSFGNRLYSHYDQIIKWSRVFLLGESFTNFRGKCLNMAILYPMEKIFEDYVGSKIKKQFADYEVSLQDRTHHLVENHNGMKKFSIRPDIVIRNSGIVQQVLDTKWKIIDQNATGPNYKISQADMYQLYAYGKKYKAVTSNPPRLILIYPKNENFTKPLQFFYENEMELVAVPYDLEEDRVEIS
jgi:5-methylcytosine-specific restriction enzyme subunit McrC